MRCTVKTPFFETASLVMTRSYGRMTGSAPRPPPRPPPASCVCGSCCGGGSCAYADAPASTTAHNGRANLTRCFFIQSSREVLAYITENFSGNVRGKARRGPCYDASAIGFKEEVSVANDPKDPGGISRREVTTRVGAAPAGVVVADIFGPFVSAAPHAGGRILGANDRIVTASIGIRGQGNSLKKGFAQLKNVTIKTLCDVDENLFASRANDKSVLDKVPDFKPGYVQDLRRVLDDKDIDAVVIAIPNHWHALASVWATQAGKHVYVEKPASHTMWEGRQMVNAARAYGRIMQVGTMNRSRPAVIDAIKFMQGGGIGKVYMARGLCFKPRLNIGKYPDGPMAPSDKPFAFTVGAEGKDGPYTAEYLAKVDYNLWQGPAPAK